MRNSSANKPPMSRLARSGDARGFTLLEVAIAVAIAALAVVVLFQAGSAGLFATHSASRVDEAVERARSHLAAFTGSDTVVPGDSEGDDGGGYRWRLSARAVAAENLLQADPTAPQATLYAVESVISWHAGGHVHSVVLQTRRLGAAVASQ
jgi:general secretion pathway protein I